MALLFVANIPLVFDEDFNAKVLLKPLDNLMPKKRSLTMPGCVDIIRS